MKIYPIKLHSQGEVLTACLMLRQEKLAPSLRRHRRQWQKSIARQNQKSLE